MAWGLLFSWRTSVCSVFVLAEEVARESGLVGKNDLIIITCGLPLAVPGSTNLVKVHRV